MMRKKLAAVAVTAAIAGGGLVMGAAPAHADSTCTTAGTVCLWDDYWMLGTKRVFGWQTKNVGVAANDKASSLGLARTNPDSPYVYFYVDDQWNGLYIIFKEGGGSNDLRNQLMTSTRNWDDEITSIRG